MSVKRFIGVSFGIVGAALLAVALYLAFADLGRHKARIEAMVTRSIGRPFAIDGPFTVKLIPVIDVRAEHVRLGNRPGGSQPQMVEVGKAVVQIGFWSLISGPPDVRSFVLSDATVVLEIGPDGKGNWIMGAPQTDAEIEAEDETDEEAGAVGVPVVIRSAQLHNVRVIYRAAKKPDRVIQLDQLDITPGREELLALDGHGKLDIYPMTLKGEAGPLKSLLSARDMRMALQVSLGKLAMDIHGVVGSLDPLDGADLTLKIEQPEVGAMLTKLNLPVIASGPMQITGQLKDAGERTQLDFDADVGELDASVKGTLKTLSLVGADLTLKVAHAEVGTLLKALELPVITSGPMSVDTRIKDAGKHRQLNLEAKLGDLEASVQGTLKTRSLFGSNLKFEATAADAARLAGVFDVKHVPAAPLTVTGHTVWSHKEIKFESLTAAIADASVRANGVLGLTHDRKLALQFELAAANIAKFKETWPQVKASVNGALELATGRVELKDLQATLGENHLAGSLLLTEARHVDAQLSSPRLDLTPFFPPDKQPDSTSKAGPSSAAPAQPEPPKKKFMFGEDPLPFVQMKETDAKVHVALGELVLRDRSIKDLDSNLRVDHGKISFDLRAAGVQGGALQGAGTLVPAADGTADLEMKLDLSDVRASLESEGLAPADVPPLGLGVNIKIHGSSPRQMASGASGHLLLTQGAGKTRSGYISAYGGGVLSQLSEKLNPFAKDDPFMKLDCTVARADIVNGAVTVKPVVFQTEKVTITAHGTIDLRTEKLLLDFNTRPRKGIGVSPGMFTNPLIRLEGTLMSPRIGVGAKGMASGAMAAASGGMTVVAGGLVDRMAGEKDICKKTLAEASSPATAAR